MINMNVRMGYINIPIDYIRELKNSGKRDKARAFMEYFDDMDIEAVNSFSFYAQSWDVSKSTAHEWVKEFKDEIERFFSYWMLKNSAYYSSVQKSPERLPNDSRTIDTLKSPIQSSFKKSSRTLTERLPNEVFNLNNDDNARVNFYDKDFEDLYLRARRFNRFAGNKEQAYHEYMSNHTHITHSDMAHAYMTYINDPKANGKIFNLTNFMKNNVYVSYLKPRLQVLKDGKMLEGWYDQSKSTLTTDNETFMLTKERFIEMVTKGEIIILQQMKAAV